MDPAELKAIVRTIPDFPKPGILFRDITTLIAHGRGFAATIDRLVDRAQMADASAVAGIEARGFIFGAAVAARLGIGFVPLRKPGKLPLDTIGIDYQLEYGDARLELDPNAIDTGEKVLLMDDLLATGGTACAAVDLLREAGAHVHHALFVIDLHELGGGEKLRAAGVTSQAIMQFGNE
ncbi:adenine phosphoribosyltransferase [Altericroceibacterium spongiae]|uniref:Adenine phosphoribosyltransferase n=1 Tax=Altericroceibacterium spongiae TaxID=2320269 RepID=A0A420EII1_9SPHN|nr:adenine phosphoribosyltransferase [Altericroceibacterium spongiae]RKF20532.1 adenine phosphoribosyltransferase [Altericroceibacterium spongiae]